LMAHLMRSSVLPSWCRSCLFTAIRYGKWKDSANEYGWFTNICSSLLQLIHSGCMVGVPTKEQETIWRRCAACAWTRSLSPLPDKYGGLLIDFGVLDYHHKYWMLVIYLESCCLS
jgi:hypothetical protein